MTAARQTEGSRFSRNKLGKKTGGLLVLGFISVMLVTTGISQSSSGIPAVSFGDAGMKLNTGELNVNGNDISDDGTVIWDASEGFIPESAVNISQVDLSTAAGSFLTWDSTNEVFDVDAGSIQSGTTAADVGLGNVLNKEQLAVDGSNSMNANIDMSTNTIENIEFISPDGSESDPRMGWWGPLNTALNGAWDSSDDNFFISSNAGISLLADTNSDEGGSYSCGITSTGDWECDGTKSWVHDLENGSEAVYTSQESPEVRAVYEGKAEVNGKTKIQLPSHYSKTVSDTESKLRATATVQGELAYAAVIEKTDDYIVLDSSEPATVNYRITGIREGYEDNKVVRPKE